VNEQNVKKNSQVKSKRSRLLVFLSIFFLIAAALIVALIFVSNSNRIVKKSNQGNSLEVKGSYNEAASKFVYSYNHSKTNSEKAKYAEYAGSAYQAAEQYTQATQWYDKAITLDKEIHSGSALSSDQQSANYNATLAAKSKSLSTGKNKK
jgi:tetratricopeptide (TPR) repeat protein